MSNRNHKRQLQANYLTLAKKTGLFTKATLIVPANRKARRQYQRVNKHEYRMPPIIMPMTGGPKRKLAEHERRKAAK